MRKLIVTRGLPGSGKSYTLGQLGLTDLTLSLDAIRLMIASPILSADGRMTIPQEHNEVAWGKAYELLGHRMARGETLVVDATHPAKADFNRYIELAKLHRYHIACLDFSEVPADVSSWQNDGRDNHRHVSEHVINRISQAMAAGGVPEGIHRIMVRSNRSHLSQTKDWLSVPTLELDDYKAVVHIGDLQGCHTVLMDALGSESLRDDTFYIFIGDACDRGDENGLILRWLIDHAIGKPNVRFLWGNHEDHLHREALGLESVSREFSEKTLPQLKDAGITRGELNAFCDSLDDIILYSYGKQKVMATHAGLSTVPCEPWMVSSRQCAHGTGRYEDDVDGQFERYAPPGWTQVHGHRNYGHREIIATEKSINLEDSVEHGGNLRIATLNQNGWMPYSVPNRIFRSFRDRSHRKMSIIPSWMAPGTTSATTMDPILRQAMIDHPEVRCKAAHAEYPHVVSFNFSKKAFFEKSWDEVSVKARGLFVNECTGSIVSRSYDKFYNIQEPNRPEMTLEGLKSSIKFPITAYLKENGFLGILGYDNETKHIFPSSKGTAEGEFAGYFKDLLNTTLSQVMLEKVRRFLRDTESTATFEVIDIERDPHIVDYPHSKLVLLDIIQRTTSFNKLPYDMLTRVSKEFGLEVKQRAITFRSWQEFDGWHKRASRDMTKRFEGYVFEDASGYQFKFKTPWYSFWKLCRGMTEAIVRERQPGGKPAKGLDPQFLAHRGLDFTANLAVEFKEWAVRQPTEELSQGIIHLRNAFESGIDFSPHSTLKL
jgi:predicted kinase